VALMAWWNGKHEQSARSKALGPPEERALTLDGLIQMMNFGGLGYPFLQGGTLVQGHEDIDASFQGWVEGAYKRNGVVFACIAVRLRTFSEARFQYQQLRGGRPGDLFGTPDLDILETPWTNATTGDLLARMLLDADLSGNAFIQRTVTPKGKPRLRRLRPDWVTIIGGSDGGPEEAEVLGYSYQPGGPASGLDPITLLPEAMAHFAPSPDPLANFRGLSWLTSVLGEIQGDGAATTHKQMFFEQGATPNLVVTLGDTQLTPQAFQDWVDKMEMTHSGIQNAYKTLYLAAGADAQVVGKDLQQIDFKAVQGAGETRIAAAAGTHPDLVGLSEGLQGSSLNEGNYKSAKRAFGDATLRPLWRNASGSLATIVAPQPGARLWYDDRHIPFLQEDRMDAVGILSKKAETIRTLTDAGYDPDTVVDAVEAEDLRRLKGSHSGMFSVQLQPPGSQPDTNGSTPVNGSTPKALPAPSN
jgi:phage portal protein BeeE